MKAKDKMIVTRKMFEAQDMGLKTIPKIVTSIMDGEYDKKFDPLTNYIANSIQSAESFDEIEADIDYAIFQLKKAKEALLIFQKQEC